MPARTRRSFIFQCFGFNQAMRIPACKLWSHEAHGQCVSMDSTGTCPPEIVVIYRLHAGALQGLFVSTVCGSVWASITRTEPVLGPYDDFQNSEVSKREPLECVQDSYIYRPMPFAPYRSLCGDNIIRIIEKSVRTRAPHSYLMGLLWANPPASTTFFHATPSPYAVWSPSGFHNFGPCGSSKQNVSLM